MSGYDGDGITTPPATAARSRCCWSKTLTQQNRTCRFHHTKERREYPHRLNFQSASATVSGSISALLLSSVCKLSYTYESNPFIDNFTVHSGTPCGESRPVWDYQYRETKPEPGTLRKWTKCACGCVTYFDVHTLTKPSNMIQVYNDDKQTHTVTVIYSEEHHKALALFDAIGKTKFKVLMFDSSNKLYESAVKFFNNEPFQVLSNATMSKLPNVSIDTSLNEAKPLISWHSDNLGFVRKLIKAKMTSLVNFFGMKPGYVYFNMKNVTKDNEKQVINFLNLEHMTKEHFIKFFTKLAPKD